MKRPREVKVEESPSKKQKTSENVDDIEIVMAQFVTKDLEPSGPKLSIPFDITEQQLSLVLNEHILKNEEKLPYSFFVNGVEIKNSNFSEILKNGDISFEGSLQIIYVPQAVFRVRSITRCTSSIEGHSEAVLITAFSPDGERLATGSGDTTVRFWETSTLMPYNQGKEHTNWVLCLAWSPDSKKLVSGSKDKTICVWDPQGNLLHKHRGHTKWITSVAWEPLHRNPDCNRFVSACKDGTAKIWELSRGCVLSFANHTQSITCIKWGGEGLIYTASQDTTIKVWAEDGKLIRVLKGHGHWVNTLSLNTDYVLRTGSYDHTLKKYDDPMEAQKRALERYNAVKGEGCEKLVSGSDDTTCYIWEPSKSKAPLCRLTGHSKLINIVSFSPDGNYITSASFDKNIRLWSSIGTHLGTFRGHVGEVFQLSWSSDSRLFVTGSKDSTLKVWDTRTKKLKIDLPGHADEVYSVDWSPDGQFVASGSKDRHVKIWRA
jgi:ribosome assembly protein 4